MSRIFSDQKNANPPRIDRTKVGDFFVERARRIEQVGPVRAVIYQDKHADLAERRDAAEKACLLPLLHLNGSQRVLDVGCGTGRWADSLLGQCSAYHGLDFCGDLVDYAKARFGMDSTCRFSVASVDDFSLASLGERQPFDRALCAGVLIYLNDDELLRALRCVADALAPAGRAVFREPVAQGQRLTIKDHFSEELEQDYHAIYRTEDEIRSFVAQAMGSQGCRLTDCGDVYADTNLNNRAETRQRWFAVERAA
jgi:cyclopropane fatty-acyl-phospholipid synthase-like methyltransferase